MRYDDPFSSSPFSAFPAGRNLHNNRPNRPLWSRSRCRRRILEDAGPPLLVAAGEQEIFARSSPNGRRDEPPLFPCPKKFTFWDTTLLPRGTFWVRVPRRPARGPRPFSSCSPAAPRRKMRDRCGPKRAPRRYSFPVINARDLADKLLPYSGLPVNATRPNRRVR